MGHPTVDCEGCGEVFLEGALEQGVVEYVLEEPDEDGELPKGEPQLLCWTCQEAIMLSNIIDWIPG